MPAPWDAEGAVVTVPEGVLSVTTEHAIFRLAVWMWWTGVDDVPFGYTAGPPR